jgi:hypothetical protein
MWLAMALLLATNDRSWGQAAVEIPTLVFSIEENSEAGTEVGALAELYPELNRFRLSKRSRSTLLQVHPDTGVISIRDGAKLDFEKRSNITLTIVADIREEQEDPYLAEFAESLRSEGFSSRTLSRLIPLERRIQVQVLVRDVEEAGEAPAASDDPGMEARAADYGSAVVPFDEAAAPENGSTDTVTPEMVMSEIRRPAPELSAVELSPPVITSPVITSPATQLLTPESKVADANMRIRDAATPEVANPLIAADDVITAPEPEVPLPSDVPSMPSEQSGANRKNLALSGSSGQAVLQLNAVTADGRGRIAPNPTEVVADQTLAAAGVDAAEMAATTRRTFLLQSMVSLIIVLGAAYLLRHRWKSFRKSLPQPQQEQVTEQTTPEVQDLTTAETALEDQAELSAADEFVTEPILDEVFPRIEQTLNPVITQEAEEDSGVPFDPESLIDDDYFNDAADLQSLRSNNAQLGDQLEARAGSVESAPKDQRPIDDLLTETTAMYCRATTTRTDEHSSVAADFSRDQDREFTDGLIRDGRSEFALGCTQPSPHDQDSVSPTEPRWNSDWPGYSDGKPDLAVATPTAATKTVAVLAEESKSTAGVETTDDKIANLRNELAELFAIQKKAQAAEAKGVASVEPVVQETPDSEDSKVKPEACPEETHLESVAQYLSQLLERSKKEEAGDAIFVERRKTSEKATGKRDGPDRRGGQKAKAPVKSYIDSYMSEQGGELTHDSASQKSPEASLDEFARPIELKPPFERRPVDVQAIRQHMNSFRNVASTSLEHALASHRIRQAKGKVAGRTTLVIGLTVVSVLAIATNSAMKIYFPSLGWLMGLIVCLAIAELILRVEAIRRQRRELRYRILEPVKNTGDRNDKGCEDAVVSGHDVSGILP